MESAVALIWTITILGSDGKKNNREIILIETNDILSSSDLIGFSLTVSSSIDMLWNIFMAIHVAIFSACALGNFSLKWIEILILGILYLLFAFLNGIGLINNYQLIALLHDSIARNLDQKFIDLTQFFTDNLYANRVYITLSIHSFCVIVVFCLLYAKRNGRIVIKTDFSKRSHSAKTKYM